MAGSDVKNAKVWIARTGLTAKGIIYLTLGVLAILTALNLKSSETNNTAVFSFIKGWPGGKWLAGALAIGLLAYCAWRFIQAFSKKERRHKKVFLFFRYLFSGLAYLSLAFAGIRLALGGSESNGNSQQKWSAKIMEMPAGEWLLGIGAAIIAGIGIFQIWYGLSEKYKEHVSDSSIDSKYSKTLLTSGKIGYIARGLVWILIGYLILQAALSSDSSKAGDTDKALQLVETGTFGTIIFAVIGIGLASYGVYNFVRAKYEKSERVIRG